MKFVIFVFCFAMVSGCNSKKTADKTNAATNSDATPVAAAGLVDKTIDTILKFQPLKLSFETDKADADEMIPVGYNDEGSMAYFVNQNRGGSSGVGFVIGPRFGEFTTETQFDMDFKLDSILPTHKQLVYYMLKAGKIKLDNHFRKITVDSLKSKYKFIFEEKKTMGPPDPEWNGEKKTLASYTLSYRRGDYDPSVLVSEHYVSKDNYYDMYISDGLIIPGQYGDYGYLVVVTESLGFEGVIRKTFEIVALGSLND